MVVMETLKPWKTRRLQELAKNATNEQLQKEIILSFFEGSENVWSVCANSSRMQTARDVSNRDVIQSELSMSQGFTYGIEIIKDYSKVWFNKAAEGL